jgi:penicillin-binding protein 1A
VAAPSRAVIGVSLHRVGPSSRSRTAAVVAVLALLLAACGPVVELAADDPLAFVEQPRTSTIVAPDGTVLADLHAEQDRTEVSLERIAPELVAAVVAVEDRRFFQHRGVDVRAIARAAVRNLEAGEIDEGGSTLTQQLVKTTMTGPARTFERKIEEAVLAWRLERTHGKDDILERYLNTVYFGRGAYGVAAAARRFFGVSADRLTTQQAALLAGVIASPARFDPWEHPDAALDRRQLVLDAMVATGALEREEATAAATSPLELVDLADRVAAEEQAPWVAAEVRRILQRDPDGRFSALGETVEERVDSMFTGGLRIVTTVDLTTQAAAETAIAARIGDDAGPSAAAVWLDPHTGAIRALVGGRAEDAGVGFNLATQGRRSPGSAYKPLVLASALERGVPLDREFPGGACVVFEEVPGWDEEGACNYGGTEYGPLTLREATVRSANTAYARLAVELGPTELVRMSRQLGITSELPEVASLGLGAGEVSPLELAGAYLPFATLGWSAEPYLIERIEAADGRTLYQHEPERFRVLDEQVAWLVTDTLQDVVRRGTGVQATLDRPQAGKTGTSQDHADAWFVGYTPDLVGAIWVGFPEARVPLRPPNVEEPIEGGRWPAELWREIAEVALAGTPPSDFPEPQLALVTVEVDVSRNCLPNPYTPPELIEAREFLGGTEPTERCTEPTGPALDDVPEVLGLPLEVATRLLTDRGFELEVRAEHSRLLPPGYVTRQRPAPRSDLAPGEVVVVWSSVSSRTRSSPPDVLGLPVDDARTVLEEAGYVVEVTRDCPCSLPPGTVHSQSPAAGTQVLDHDLIRLTAVPDDPPEQPDEDAEPEPNAGTD